MVRVVLRVTCGIVKGFGFRIDGLGVWGPRGHILETAVNPMNPASPMKPHSSQQALYKALESLELHIYKSIYIYMFYTCI